MSLQEDLVKWKRQYGRVFSVSIRKTTFVFRPLTIGDFNNVLNTKASSAETEEQIIFDAVLYPYEFNLDMLKAGEVSTLAAKIRDASGFTNLKAISEFLEEKRNSVGRFDIVMKAFILATMPYKEEELDQFNCYQLLEKVVLAEQILKIRQGTADATTEIKFALIDPEKEAEEEEKNKAKFLANKKPGQSGYDDPVARKLHALG